MLVEAAHDTDVVGRQDELSLPTTDRSGLHPPVKETEPA
jgi:hypothetical protein